MRRLSILVPVLLLVLATPARSEEAAPQSGVLDPARVGRLLLSDDEDERARGAALLRRRVQQGGDLQTWLVAMARAQAAWADAEDRLVERWIDEVLHGTPERAAQARRMIAAVGREATQRLLQALKDVQQLVPKVVAGQVREPRAPGAPVPQRPPIPPPQQLEAPPPPAAEEAQVEPEPAGPPIGLLLASVLEVPRAELLGTLEDAPPGLDTHRLLPLAHDRPVLIVAGTPTVFAWASALPEARDRTGMHRLATLSRGSGVALVEGDAVSYRSRARRTKGAWAVDTETLRRGLGVTVRLVPSADGDRLEVEARYVSIPDPLPTEQVRPSGDVEPLELDRPEWETASMRVSAPVPSAREEVVAFFPALVPDRIVVVGLRVRPLESPAAAREQTK